MLRLGQNFRKRPTTPRLPAVIVILDRWERADSTPEVDGRLPWDWFLGKLSTQHESKVSNAARAYDAPK